MNEEERILNEYTESDADMKVAAEENAETVDTEKTVNIVEAVDTVDTENTVDIENAASEVTASEVLVAENSVEETQVSEILTDDMAENEVCDIQLDKNISGDNQVEKNVGYYPWQTEPLTQEKVESKPAKKSGFFKKILKTAVLAATFGIVASAFFIGGNTLYNKLFNDESNQLPGIYSTSISNVNGNGTPSYYKSLQTVDLSEVGDMEYSPAVAVCDQNLPATVVITCKKVTKKYDWFGRVFEEESTGGGSGIIVNMSDSELLVATNYHVVDSATEIILTMCDGFECVATLKGKDSSADLAIVSVPLTSIDEETVDQIRVAKIGNSNETKMGEMVIAIGNALGYGPTLTVGYVSAIDRNVVIDGNEMTLLQTDAAINHGNSGGGLFNTRGEVIGITSAKYTDTSVEGVCFAIPISRAIPILEELMNREVVPESERGYLGVQIATVSDGEIENYGIPAGVRLANVYRKDSEIYKGDIIVKVGEIEVKTTDELQDIVASHRAGDNLTITIKRQEYGEYREHVITLRLFTYEEAFASMQEDLNE
ncbi:MAG: S1C family serine protease [Lachnospiraceae bacterium]|nr:S1C family serine protease [Lachnospiraceae bacterium]